jgi:uncharacterized protein (DUF1778 family)
MPASDKKPERHPITIRLSDTERDLISKVAENEGLSPSTWLRMVGLAAAKDRNKILNDVSSAAAK